MTTKELYKKHKSGDISNQKFLYEVRRDAHLPWINNLTSYEDAVKILKNKGIINEADSKKYGDVEVISKTIDMVNPYEYSKGMNYELDMADNAVRTDLTEEEVLAAQKIVLKNITKDANYYTRLYAGQKINDTEGYKEIEIEGKKLEPNLKAEMKGRKADGYLKKEAIKSPKSNVKVDLGKKEAGKKKPKGVSEFKDKGVTGSFKTIKEGIEEIIREKLAKKKANEATNFSEPWKYDFVKDGDDCIKIDPETGTRSKVHHTYCKRTQNEVETKMKEHHNDDDFPVVSGLYELLDAIVADWGKEDLYHEVEDVVVAYTESDATTISREAIKKIKDVLENYDVLEDYAELVNKIAVKEPGEAPTAIDRMYNSDAWVQAQRDMNESSPKKSAIDKMKEALKSSLKTEKLDAAALKTAVEKGTALNISKANAADISAAKSAKANFTTYE
jgi:hypothetical protein